MARRDPEFFPRPGDARWNILLFQLAFVGYALVAPGFNRGGLQFVSALAAAAACDAVLRRVRDGRWGFPLSGVITGLGLVLLVDSAFVWTYAVLGAAAIASKALVRGARGHLFNPSNFALVCGLLFLSGEVTVVASRWGGSGAGLAAVVALGLVAAGRAGRLDVALPYMAFYALGAALRAAAAGTPFWIVAGAMTGAQFHLFTFYMITDPRTTPGTRRERVAFGAAVALVELALLFAETRFAEFYALFVVCAAFSALPRRSASRAR